MDILLLPRHWTTGCPQGHLARFVADLVDDVLDLGPVLADYTDKRGCPPYEPRLMMRLLIHGCTTGVRSSRAIARKCVDDIAFRFLAAQSGWSSLSDRSSWIVDVDCDLDTRG